MDISVAGEFSELAGEDMYHVCPMDEDMGSGGSSGG
jgi:hypothetical protein